MYYKLDSEQRDTVLAALRTYQAAGYGEPGMRPDDIHDIATDGGSNMGSLNDAGIDELCELLNTGLDIERADECPSCGSLYEVTGFSVDIDEDMATQRCACNVCDAEWVLGFGLTSVLKL